MQPELVRTKSANPNIAMVVIRRAIVRPLCPVVIAVEWIEVCHGIAGSANRNLSRHGRATPAAPSVVVIVLVWGKLAGFSGYDEKRGSTSCHQV
jgi:hypothetical protein